MIRNRAIGTLVIIVVLLLVSCGQSLPSPASPTTDPLESKSNDGYETVVDALRGTGIPVEVVGRQDAIYFGGDGYDILVNGVSVRVFEYADEAARQTDSDALSSDGWVITRQEGEFTVETHLEWIDQPNLWAQGRVIVLYVGADAATQRLLSGTLGESITAQTLLEKGYPQAALQAQEMARVVSSLANVQIDIVSFEPVTWGDSCLGAGQPDEVCAEVITPGWIVVLRDPHGELAMHTDLFGERMRRGPDPDPAGETEPTPTAVPVPTQTNVPVPTPTNVPVPTQTNVPVPTPTISPAGVRLYSNPFFLVTLEYPDHWQHEEGEPQSGDRYGGSDGFFLVGAMDAGDRPLDDVASSEAGHILRPYGSEPKIERLEVAGQEARLILPSADQSMGPLGQAMLIVRYPVPVEIGGHVYPLFTLTAVPDQIRDLAASLQFITD